MIADYIDMYRTFFGILIIILISFPLYASDIDGEFVVFSSGTHSCSEYLSARRASPAAMEIYSQWLSGYLSAFNLIVINTYDIAGGMGYPEIIHWLDEFCLENHEVSFANATAALTVALYPKRLNQAPEKPTNGKQNSTDALLSAEYLPTK